MTIYKIKSESTATPQAIQVRKLSGSLYEFIGHQDITPKQIMRDDEMVTIYDSTMTHITTSINSRDDMIVALIRLRYTQDTEFAMINKGIEDSANAEYVAYREYVTLCKEQANTYYGEA